MPPIAWNAGSKKATGGNGNGKAAKHTQADLVAYAKSLNIEGADFVTVMSTAGFKNADLQSMERWDEMVQALKVAAGVVATPGL